MKWTFSVAVCLVILFCKFSSPVRVVKLGGKDCDYQGAKICNGAVTKEIGKSFLKVCSDGKLRTKKRVDVGEGFPLVGRDTGPGKVVKLGGKDCEFEGGKICNGAVTKEIGTKLVKVCVDGKIKTRTRKSVGEGFPLVGRDTGEGKDCIWYGTTFCDGDVVEDLYRWWFKMKCSRTRFSVDSSSWAEVRKRKQQESQI